MDQLKAKLIPKIFLEFFESEFSIFFCVKTVENGFDVVALSRSHKSIHHKFQSEGLENKLRHEEVHVLKETVYFCAVNLKVELRRYLEKRVVDCRV